jgi:hypothetical protein
MAPSTLYNSGCSAKSSMAALLASNNASLYSFAPFVHSSNLETIEL